MAQADLRSKLEGLLALADIRINGDRPWDLQVHNPDLYQRVFAAGSLGLGEAYMDGWWDCERLDELFFRALRAELDVRIQPWTFFFTVLRARLFNLQRRSRAFQVGQRHYDLGNDLFHVMLDRRMIYSCGFWEAAATLDEAQEAKLELASQKLHLAPGMRVLDIGCGWGGTAQFLAERYGVEVVGVTVSKEQVEAAQDVCRGLPVQILLEDYRNVRGQFDRIISIGMFEHVGYKNYRTFMRVMRDHLKDDGLALLHTIGNNYRVGAVDPWITRYIFPNSAIPAPGHIAAAIDRVFVLEDWHNFGAHYDRTLMAWFDNFTRNWPALQAKYGERFHRMWNYYLLSCAGSFRSRATQVWQVVLSPRGVVNGYRPVRRAAERHWHVPLAPSS